MLLFQKDYDHIIKRGKERVGITEEEIVRIVADINLYLPDDWRMTRSSNSFIIYVKDKTSFIIAGCCYRYRHQTINRIDSIFKTDFFDKNDAIFVEQTQNERFNKRKNPESLVPNVYYFKKPPENAPSPLFARQYEKIKLNNNQILGDQYHRIHPLTKDGLDLFHYRWIKWNRLGNIEFTESVPEDYHGKSFWDIPEMRNPTNLMNEYYQKIQEFDIKVSTKQNSILLYENEYKYSIDKQKYDTILYFIRSKEPIIQDFKAVTIESKPRQQVDYYFDDDKFSLFIDGISLRIRKKKDNTRITLKYKFSENRNLYRRIEEEAVINEKMEKELFLGNPINCLPYKLIYYISPLCNQLKNVLNITNSRRTFVYENTAIEKIELSLDEFHVDADNVKHGPFYELEIEKKNATNEDVGVFADFFREKFNLEVSKHSKYEIGVDYLKK